MEFITGFLFERMYECLTDTFEHLLNIRIRARKKILMPTNADMNAADGTHSTQSTNVIKMIITKLVINWKYLIRTIGTYLDSFVCLGTGPFATARSAPQTQNLRHSPSVDTPLDNAVV
jgi:hypothetical protein